MAATKEIKSMVRARVTCAVREAAETEHSAKAVSSQCCTAAFKAECQSLYLLFKGTKKLQAAEVGEHTDEVATVTQTGLDLIL